MRKNPGRLIACLIIVTLLLSGLTALLVWNGWILLNNPSRKTYPVRGVDVSRYQGEIDWKVLSGQGIDFAYIKATEGSSHIDEKYAYNWEEAGKTSLYRGAYHFFSFDSPGQSQLQHFIGCVKASENMLPPVVDVEFYGDKKVHPPDPETVETELSAMLTGLEEHYKMTPIIYATEESWNLYIKGRFEAYPLWIRNVVSKPDTGGSPWLIWQYSNRKRMKGFLGDEKFIDINVFNESRSQWEEWAGRGSRVNEDGNN